MTARLDAALVARGLARSRAVAVQAVADGRVTVDGRTASRPSLPVSDADDLAVHAADDRVGRGGVKLAAALDAFGIAVAGRAALDLGASTGGFTEVLLQRGAASVVALDVGHGQLVPAIAADRRVTVVEGENARFLDAERLAALTGDAPPPEVVVADLSFISLRLVLPAIAAVAAARVDVVVLIKPQFEVGRQLVGDGVVRDPSARVAAVAGVLEAAAQTGLAAVAMIRSPIAGGAGNIEVLAHLRSAAHPDPAEWSRRIESIVQADGQGTG